jgi:hypothetical protein
VLPARPPPAYYPGVSPTLTAAAVLALLVGAAHSSLGERYILVRLFRRHLAWVVFAGIAAAAWSGTG